MTISISVDPTNPGQFFACCGLLELADRLWGGVLGNFSVDGRQFEIKAASSRENLSPELLLTSLAACPIQSSLGEKLARLKKLLNQEKKTLSVEDEREKERLKAERDRERLHFGDPFNIWIDWWRDELTGGKRFKTWAGKQIILDLARDLQSCILKSQGSIAAAEECLFRGVADSGLPLYFDADIGGQSSTLDVGFSLDALDMRPKRRPFLELAAFVGLQRFRPTWSQSTNSYSYLLWSEPLPPTLAAVVCTGNLPIYELKGYQFHLFYRTKYLKSFLPAVPLSRTGEQ